MKYINNYNIFTERLNVLGSWSYEEIVGIKYDIDIDYEGNYITTIDLVFFLSVIKTKQRFRLKVRYHNVSELSLRQVTNLYLTDSLIIHDKSEQGWDLNQRYHVHDDSGYGDNDGYNFINFHCSSIEAITLEEF
ncbi:hypothetical protein D3P09_06700 [Paenibacillus pinisoli]|uniref:Uncharacterized protein n=1 Tax=Paenibacillus pinisoli TaxID=1276110 RepID=A0A3A6Q2H4_9BACL|nr:hypothetical protein [Paenibacillus pinisoli]RJX41643.1 hypothetical protein D3P09_06700 [Paenibacillus pinisoli]